MMVQHPLGKGAADADGRAALGQEAQHPDRRLRQGRVGGGDSGAALTEFGLWGQDKPGYVKRIFRFTRSRKLMRMMVYYQDFGSSNAFRIQNFPRSRKALKRQLGRDVFPRYAPRFPRQGRQSGKGGGVNVR